MARGPRVAVVLGAGGLLGSEVVPALQAAGWEVRALARGEADVTRPETLWLAPAHLVVNCAAYTKVDAAETEPERAFAVNATGAAHVAEATPAGATLIHLSTDYVFDGTSTTPYREEEPPNPQGVYARSKREGEVRAQAHPRAVIVRTAALYGSHGNNFFRAILNRVRQGLPLRVVADQVTAPTWSRDLAAQIAELADAPPGIYHATAHGQCTWYEAAREITPDVTPISTEEYGAPAPRPRYSILHHGALQRLGRDRMRDWRVALREWLKEAP